jgi:S-adenosylmethionine-diacylglycerol 3-amino-3-carboxypropyl transferase
LDYLLDGPAEVHAVDVNPAQNALLQLKLAVIQGGDFDDHLKLFGNGCHRSFDGVLKRVDGFLSPFARDFWRAKNDYFGLSGLRKSFYYRGTAGAAAWLFQKTLLRAKKNIRHLVFDLFDAGSVEEQEEIYREIELTLWDSLTSWLLDQPLVMTLFGVPRPQAQLIATTYRGGIHAYLRDRVRHVLTQLSTRENYFWRVYLHGSYSRSCCPNYLKEENFDRLRERAEVVRTHDQTLASFLSENPSRYTHFVLLDHQDWLAHHAPAELEEEWRLILENSSPGTRILMRSAGLDLSFLPVLARKALCFFPDWTASLHRQDRVGTYGSTHFAEVV